METITLINNYKEPSEPYNIISTVVFRLQHVYKDERMYYDGLRALADTFEKSFPNFYLRIYYDSSVLENNDPHKIEATKTKWKPLFESLSRNKKVQLVKYNMQKFRINETYHNGLIGTLVRFIPLFDLDINKNIREVLISDIDVAGSIYKYKRDYEVFKKSSVKVFYRTRGCYENQPRFYPVENIIDTKHAIIAAELMSRIKFPKYLFEDFMECVLNENNKGCEYYKKFKDYTREGADPNMIQYGVDELFLLLIKKYLNDKKIPHMIFLLNDIASPIYYVYQKYLNGKFPKSRMDRLIKFLLEDEYDKNKSTEDNYTVLDKKLYRQKKDDNFIKIMNRMKKLMRILKKKNIYKKYGMSMRDVECILEQDINKPFIVRK